jgi:Arylsulfotransferase (ASST)
LDNRMSRQVDAWLVNAAMAILAPLAMQTATAEPSVFPTGVTRYDPARAYNSYVVFGGADGKTHLIDMNGNEVRQWAYAGLPSELLDPQVTGGKRGHVLVQLATLEDDKDPNTGTSLNPGQKLLHGNKTIGELDWDGKVVWEWGDHAPGGAARQHHDWYRLSNGNTLVLANWIHAVPGFKLERLYDDVVYEVTPQGNVVWKWAASDHLAEFGFTPASLKLIHDTAQPDYLHINDMTALGPNHWFDAGDKRFDPDNILIDSREANFIAIIDKRTGSVVWRVGPDLPASREGKAVVPRPVDQISGQHDAHLIPEGLPGAGNLLVFDNQGEAGYPPQPLGVLSGSRVLEIDPTKTEIVWQYTGVDSGRPAWTFYSSFISSARRLPNGNTLIDEGMNGRFFQITTKGEIVWEYVSPYFAPAPFGGKAGTVSSNYVYRAQPVPYAWIPVGTPHTEKAVAPPSLGAP